MLCVHVINKCRLTKREREGEGIENWNETKKDTRGQVEIGRQRHKHKTGGERDGWTSQVQVGRTQKEMD